MQCINAPGLLLSIDHRCYKAIVSLCFDFIVLINIRDLSAVVVVFVTTLNHIKITGTVHSRQHGHRNMITSSWP